MFTTRSAGRSLEFEWIEFPNELLQFIVHRALLVSFVFTKAQKIMNMFLVHQKSHSLHSPFNNNIAMQFIIMYVISSFFSFCWCVWCVPHSLHWTQEEKWHPWLSMRQGFCIWCCCCYHIITYLSFYVANIGSSMILSANIRMQRFACAFESAVWSLVICLFYLTSGCIIDIVRFSWQMQCTHTPKIVVNTLFLNDSVVMTNDQW